jgi:hypothetical protein
MPGSLVYLKRRDEASLAATVLLRDTRGREIGALRAVQARGVMAEGEATTTRLLTTFVGAGVLMGAVMLVAVELGLVRAASRHPAGYPRDRPHGAGRSACSCARR